jgi:hypothetical protein
MDGATNLIITRPFAAGPFGFSVAASTATDRDLVESLFGDLPHPDPNEPVHVFLLTRDLAREDTGWSLSGPRLEGQPTMSRVSAITRLMSAVNLCALDYDPEPLHLHAAAAARDGSAVIIAAKRNTGKTTTIAQLVLRRWEFITDEMVGLPPHRNEVRGFAKPLSIKPGGHRLVDQFAAWMLPDAAGNAEGFRYVPVGASGARIAEVAVPRLVVLLRRSEDDRPTTAGWRELDPADAVVALMQETLDAERFGAAALRLGRLAASTRCVEVMIGTPDQTAALIERLFDEEPPDRVEVSLLEDSPAIAPPTVSVDIGGRIVVHQQDTGQIFALDEAASRVWRQLGGWADSGIDLTGPVIAPFVEQLRAMGALASASATRHPTVRGGQP